MKTLLLLVVLTATAWADGSGAASRQGFAPRPVPATCPIKGASIIEIEVAFDAMLGQHPHSTVTSVYANGAWTRLRRSEDQKTPTPHVGCLDKKQLDAIQADLKAATWTITHNRITCKAISARHVIYRIAGKQKWDSHVCGADVVDDKTAKALADIDAQLAGLPDVDPDPETH
jgi:hypothetical protein